jgi:hypothetical protein
VKKAENIYVSVDVSYSIEVSLADVEKKSSGDESIFDKEGKRELPFLTLLHNLRVLNPWISHITWKLLLSSLKLEDDSAMED